MSSDSPNEGLLPQSTSSLKMNTGSPYTGRRMSFGIGGAGNIRESSRHLQSEDLVQEHLHPKPLDDHELTPECASQGMSQRLPSTTSTSPKTATSGVEAVPQRAPPPPVPLGRRGSSMG